jgi:hypothetical protein
MATTMVWLMLLAASTLAVIPSGLKHPSIGVFIDFDAAPSQRSVEEMKKEAAKIMGSAGYSLDWRALDQNRGREAFAAVVVVKFKGKCRLEFPATTGASSDEAVTLAKTKVEGGHVLPFSEVECDKVRQVLPYAPPRERQKALGLALGRVVAHELYHFLADKTKHAGAGLASATHDWLELISGAAAFREHDLPPAQGFVESH